MQGFNFKMFTSFSISKLKFHLYIITWLDSVANIASDTGHKLSAHVASVSAGTITPAVTSTFFSTDASLYG